MHSTGTAASISCQQMAVTARQTNELSTPQYSRLEVLTQPRCPHYVNNAVLTDYTVQLNGRLLNVLRRSPQPHRPVLWTFQ